MLFFDVPLVCLYINDPFQLIENENEWIVFGMEGKGGRKTQI